MSTDSRSHPDSQPVIKLYRGQRYELVRTEPYTRVDGGHTNLAIWRSACPRCGETFETRTSVRARKFGNRRCPKHKRPGVRVNRTGEADMRQGSGRLVRADDDESR